MSKITRVDFKSKERLPDSPPQPTSKPRKRIEFSRPESKGGTSLVDVAVDAILKVKTIEVNGQADQPGTMEPVDWMDEALSQLTEEEQAAAWDSALTIVNETLNPKN